MTIEVTAKKVEDAINQGLAQLGVGLDEVNVEVVEAGGLFRKAKVRLTLERESEASKEGTNKSEPAKKEEPAPVKSEPEKAEKPESKEPAAEKTEKQNAQVTKKQKNDTAKPETKNEGGEPVADKSEKLARNNAPKKETNDSEAESAQHIERAKPRKLSDEDKVAAAHALEFVKETAQKMGFTDLTVEADENPELINITAPAGDDSLIIGRHGETLSALSYLAETCARAEKCHISITVDCNGYRDRRAASLTAMAKRRANECVAKHRKIKLEPMDRVDRRTIHNALTDDNRVSTASEGKEPYRYVVIIPNKKQ